MEYGQYFGNLTLSFIKLRNQVPGKQINADNDARADKYINGEYPPPGESAVWNQPVEQEIISYILRPMDKSDEKQIKHQQENAHCHAEKTDKCNKLSVFLKAS